MGRSNVREPIPLYLGDNGLPGLTYNALVPKLFSQTIAKIVVFLQIDFDIPNREIVTFQANGIGICLWLLVFVSIPFLVKLSGFIYALDRIPGKKCIYFFVFQNEEKGIYIFFRESP